MSRGALYILTCYIMWGFLPIYWKAFSALPGLETTAHRIVWSALFTATLLTWQRNWQWLRQVARQPRIVITFLATAGLILVNWLIYIYAVNTSQLVESSLGYFINPLVHVLLGVIFLHERPRFAQWIALGLASSFAFYALLKKTTSVPALEGLFLESGVLAIPLGIYLLVLNARGIGTFGHTNWQMTALLLGAGVLTALPLLLFSAGAQRVPMTVIGLLQYIAPTIQFILGITLFGEPFSQSQLLGFSFIWMALLLFTLESGIERRRLQLALRPIK